MSVRVPPSDLDAEAVVLSDLLLDPRHIDDVRDVLSPGDFYADANRLVYEGILELRGSGREVDLATVATWLRDRGHLDRVGGTPYLAQIVEATPAVAHVDEHVHVVLAKARQRRVLDACRAAVAEGYGDVGDPDEWVQRVAQAIETAAEGPAHVRGQLLADMYREHFELLDEVRSGARDALLMPTGFAALDEHLGGGLSREPYVVAARPRMGKSSFALCIARNVARRGKAAVFLSAEMSATQIGMRLASLESRVPVSASNNPRRLSREDYLALKLGGQAASRLPLYVWDKKGAKVSELRSATREGMRALRRVHGSDLELGLIVVDYIQVLDGVRGRDESREQEVSRLSRQIMLGMCQDFGCPVLVLSQLNRSVESRPNKRPVMSDLRDSGTLEQDAYGILMLYRDEVYNRETKEPAVAEVGIVKHRNGAEGTVKLAFHGEWTMFEDLPTSAYDDDFGPLEYDIPAGKRPPDDQDDLDRRYP